MPAGWLAFVLHAHLPFIRHPDRHDYLEERWLFEAITECYLPLLSVFEGWVRDQIPARLTLTMSPPLLNMLADPLLQDRYRQHMERLLLLGELEIERTRGDDQFHPLAIMYHDRFAHHLHRFEHEYGRDLIGAFRRLMDQGILEIIPCPATHGYLPLMKDNPQAQRAQLQVAVDVYWQYFNRAPLGIWLSECAYHPGLDQLLMEKGIGYFITDAHGILYATPQPRYGLFAPLRTPHGAAAFGRDMESSRQVWSKDEGYPGDVDYREYYRDVGYDQDFEYLRPFIHPEGIRLHTGFKYHRITEREGHHKEAYVPEWAAGKARQHAENFIFNRQQQVRYLNGLMDRPPMILSPYDAELFGHWWYEGPQFIDQVFRCRARVAPELQMATPGDYLKSGLPIQPAEPCESSWGADGCHQVWLNETNHWLYRHLHQAADRMVDLASRYHHPDGWQHRILNQMARELLLAQSSDWAFIMKTGTTVKYATNRSLYHLNNCTRLEEMLRNCDNGLHGAWLEELNDMEDRNNVFPSIDYRIYQTQAQH
ncbi:glycoside hydrolase family 57 protein [Heliophilum fasciatum]|uniref:1,4-alpha-glucan branching enzyme n=1 Tax=Heliophilum fasciatum TaxID=35700 RepID=A0A4R2RUS1_9FIRM|nr:1,4-alpha-glucan branching protein domain-containing protein [Heliophilum fasciatum]MCW2277254.1 1,4-alpha-glucan branching enzyme [Heliophilum fasciatum]TCP68112.1 1,4-alpha-glucan branching enzyme [Heliophilum fasciatum]